MIEAVILSLGDSVSLPFRRVLFRSVGATLALLIAVGVVLQWLLAREVALPYHWLDTAFSILTGVGLLIGLGFLVAPVTALVAGLFLDEIADVVERTHYPADAPGRALPALRSAVLSLRFLAVVLLVNAVALPLVLVIGFGVAIFLTANAYLLGREYFELAAMRFHPPDAARELRRQHAMRIFAAGLTIAVFLAIPFVNLLTPLFATALMVHIHKQIAADERRSDGRRSGPSSH